MEKWRIKLQQGRTFGDFIRYDHHRDDRLTRFLDNRLVETKMGGVFPRRIVHGEYPVV